MEAVKDIICYIASSRSAWDKWDPVSTLSTHTPQKIVISLAFSIF